MKRLLFSAALLVAISASLQAVPLWMNMENGTTVVADHISVSNVSMGAGDASNPAYFSFVLTPDSGFQINFADFSFLAGPATGLPGGVWFASSLDGFGSKIGSIGSGLPVSLTGSSFQGITRPIEFRLYGLDFIDGVGASSLSQFAFHGSVSPSGPAPVPESAPGLLAFAAAAGLLAAARYRFRV